MNGHRIYSTSVASVYPHYVAKAERKGRTRAEVDAIFCWLTGHDQQGLEGELAAGTSFGDFFAEAPAMNPARALITGEAADAAIRHHDLSALLWAQGYPRRSWVLG